MPSTVLRLIACWVLLLALAGPARPDEEAAPVRPGMTPQQVRERLGPPSRLCRQVLAQRYLEQWLYEAPHHLRLEFDCPRGQPAKLITVRPLAAR